MRRFVIPSLVGLVVLYALAVAAFAMLHYDGDRPSGGRVIGDFHEWLGVYERGPEKVVPPPHAPPPSEPEPPPYVPPPAPTPEPVVDEPVTDEEKTALEAADKTLGEVEAQVKALRDMDRGAEFDAARLKALGSLSEVRGTLNPILDKHPRHRKANKLWDRLQGLHNAVSHL